MLGTLNCLIKAKTSILTDKLRKEIIKENKNINFSYLALIKESLPHCHDILLSNAWGGIQLYEKDSLINLYNAINIK